MTRSVAPPWPTPTRWMAASFVVVNVVVLVGTALEIPSQGLPTDAGGWTGAIVTVSLCLVPFFAWLGLRRHWHETICTVLLLLGGLWTIAVSFTAFFVLFGIAR